LPDTAPVRWHSDDTTAIASAPEAAAPFPAMSTSLTRGLRGRCPACGEGRIFRAYLKVVDNCESCAAPLGAVRADDAPPYFTIFAVGHVIVPGMLLLEKAATPPLWVHSAIWLPLTVILAMALMQPIKGATIGLMLKLGFARTPGHA